MEPAGMKHPSYSSSAEDSWGSPGGLIELHRGEREKTNCEDNLQGEVGAIYDPRRIMTRV